MNTDDGATDQQRAQEDVLAAAMAREEDAGAPNEQKSTLDTTRRQMFLPRASSWEASSPREMMSPLAPVARHRVDLRRIGALAGLACLVVILLLLLFPLLWVPPALSTLNTVALAEVPVGQVLFASSGQLTADHRQGENDLVTLTLHSLPPVATGKALYAWLLPDEGQDEAKPLLLGTVTPSPGLFQLSYHDPHHDNLLALSSRFLLTEEAASPTPALPSPDARTWRATGQIPAIPTPGDEHQYSFLSHLRHLLAADPSLQALGLSGGLIAWLDHNSEKVLEGATAARDQWPNPGSSADLTHRQVVRILQYLDGLASSEQDTPAGTPWLIDQQAGQVGLLDTDENQEPPGYLFHVLLHVSGLLHAPGATPAQEQVAMQISAELQPLIPLYQDLRADARSLVAMSDQQLQEPNALTLLNAMASKATAAYAGQLDPLTGTTQVGIRLIDEQIQSLGTMTIMPIRRP